MITQYVQEYLNRAHYEIIEDEDPYYGEIAELQEIWAVGKNIEECRRNLREAVEGWILVSIKTGLPIPKVGSCEIKDVRELSVWCQDCFP